MEAWSRHHPRPPCTDAEEERARWNAEEIARGVVGFGALSFLAVCTVGAYEIREEMRANHTEEVKSLLLHDE
jgi:hypothetical protein